MIIERIELGTWTGTHVFMYLLNKPLKGTTLLNGCIIILISNYCLKNYIICIKYI